MEGTRTHFYTIEVLAAIAVVQKRATTALQCSNIPGSLHLFYLIVIIFFFMFSFSTKLDIREFQLLVGREMYGKA